MKRILMTFLMMPIFTLMGCIIYPLQTVASLKVTVVDSQTGLPIENANVLRIVCDIHDRRCKNLVIDTEQTNENGKIKLRNKRKFGIWFIAPGGLPVPNHQIAIWKDGYFAFIFSQYDNDIEKFASGTGNKEILEAVSKIPKERKYLPEDADPNRVFLNGTVELYKLEQTENHNKSVNRSLTRDRGTGEADPGRAIDCRER